MTSRRTRSAAVSALTAAALAAVPAVASAHPSVFFVTPQKAAGSPVGSSLANDAAQYAIAQHGFTRVLKETNGLTSHGILDYKYLPSAWRNFAGRTKTEVLAQGDTGAQPHATCQGLAQLDEAAILAWQGADPFYNYVPWQKTAVGLDDGDELAAWLGVVKTRTGVDLASLADDAAAKVACEGLGGTYYAADATQTAGSSLASADIAAVADPLKLQVTSLTELAEQRRVALAAEQVRAAAITATNAAPLKVAIASTDLSAAAIVKSGLSLKVSGVAGDPVVVHVKVSAARAAKLRLPSRTIGTLTQRLDGSGVGTFVVPLSKSAAAKLGGLKGSLPLSVQAQIATTAVTTTAIKG